jgi:hypothetical protein
MCVVLLGVGQFSVSAAWALGNAGLDDYDLYVTNSTNEEFTLTYTDPTGETTTIGSVTSSNHRPKFTGLATNGADSIEITATNIADSSDVRTIHAKRRGTEYWVTIN